MAKASTSNTSLLWLASSVTPAEGPISVVVPEPSRFRSLPFNVIVLLVEKTVGLNVMVVFELPFAMATALRRLTLPLPAAKRTSAVLLTTTVENRTRLSSGSMALRKACASVRFFCDVRQEVDRSFRS